MKAILMSIQPKWVAKILNGEKTIEIRKRFPLNYRGWVYIYCTKDKSDNLYKNRNGWFANEMGVIFVNGNPIYDNYNGKVVARFYCDNVEEIGYNYRCDFTSVYTDTLDTEDLEKQSCLTKYEFAKYLQGNYGYAIHISQLEIFDKPKELNEFQGRCNNCEAYRLKVCKLNSKNCDRHLTKAPQNYRYVENNI